MTTAAQIFSDFMDDDQCFAWGYLFNSGWSALVTAMGVKAKQIGLTQQEDKPYLVWYRGGREEVRWAFVNDPANIDNIRAIYTNPANAKTPLCYIVVKQPDAHDTRGDVVFDIFRLRPTSYLEHHNRVYTPPASVS